MAATATVKCTDHDTLDMEGQWKLLQSFAPEVEAERQDPPSAFALELHVIGPGTHGGVLFEGAYTDGQVGTITGETFYHQRGVVAVQMTMAAPDTHCYYQLFAGKHVPDDGFIDGAWVDVARYFGRFRMLR